MRPQPEEIIKKFIQDIFLKLGFLEKITMKHFCNLFWWALFEIP